jgi:hypothetical protein
MNKADTELNVVQATKTTGHLSVGYDMVNDIAQDTEENLQEDATRIYQFETKSKNDTTEKNLDFTASSLEKQQDDDAVGKENEIKENKNPSAHEPLSIIPKNGKQNHEVINTGNKKLEEKQKKKMSVGEKRQVASKSKTMSNESCQNNEKLSVQADEGDNFSNISNLKSQQESETRSSNVIYQTLNLPDISSNEGKSKIMCTDNISSNFSNTVIDNCATDEHGNFVVRCDESEVSTKRQSETENMENLNIYSNISEAKENQEQGSEILGKITNIIWIQDHEEQILPGKIVPTEPNYKQDEEKLPYRINVSEESHVQSVEENMLPYFPAGSPQCERICEGK